MTELEKYISAQIATLIPNYDKIDFRANVGDTSYSVEFFVTTNGKKMQCFDMVDEGLIKEKDLDCVSEKIANYIRSTANYAKGSINKIKFSITQ